MAWNGSFSEDWLSWYLGQVDKIASINAGLGRAASPAEIDFQIAEMRKIVNSVEREGQRYIKEDLSAQFREQYRAAGGGVLTKQARDAAYRERKKVRRSLEANVRAMRTWTNTAGPAAKTNKAYTIMRNRLMVLGSQLPGAKGATADAIREEQARLKQQIEGLPNIEQPQYPTIGYRARRKTRLRGGQVILRGEEMRQVNVKDHMAGVSRRADTITTNTAFLLAMPAGTTVIVTDGADCGWTSHDDPQKANGMRVTLEQALAHPLAHENCRRSFSQGPKSRKKISRDLKQSAQTRAQQLARAAERANSLKLSALPQSAQAWASYISVASAVIGGASQVSRNPAVRSMIIGIVNNSQTALPSWMRAVSQKFAGFRAAEQSLARRLSVTVPVLRDQIQGELDNVFVSTADRAWNDQVRISADAARVLGVGRDVDKDSLYSAYKVFNDHVEFERSKLAGTLGNLIDAQYSAQVREVTTDLGVAALDLHLVQGRMPGVPARINQIIAAARKAGTVDTNFLARELVRGGAELLNVPALKLGFGELRFTVGTSQEARGRLAVQLFDKLRKTDRWTAADIRWAEQIGIKLPTLEKITKQDVVNGLLPRITWSPGGVVGLGIHMKDGNLVPFTRLYPPGSLRKWISLESHLKTPAITDFVNDIRQQLEFKGISTLKGGVEYFASGEGRQWMQARLGLSLDSATGIRKPGLIDEAVTSINLVRQGPLQASIRFYGDQLESYGIRAFQDSEVFRLRYRYYKNWRGLGERPGFGRTDLVLLPTRRGGMRLTHVDDEAVLNLMRLHVYKGSLMGVHKVTGISLTELSLWYQRTIDEVGDYMKVARSINWDAVRSTEDLRRALDRIALKAERQSILDEARAGFSTRKFEQQRELVTRVVRDRFPNLPRVPIHVVDDNVGPFDIYFDKSAKAIFVKQDLVDTWAEHGRLRSKMVGAGMFPAGTQDTAATIVHEMGHAMYETLPLNWQRDIWRRIGQLDIWPKTSGIWNYLDEAGRTRNGRLTVDEYQSLKRAGRLVSQEPDLVYDFPFISLENASTKYDLNTAVGHWMGSYYRQRTARMDRVVGAIRNEISMYSTSGPEEFIAEAFAEYLTSARPRRVAVIVGRAFEEYFNRALRSV